MSREQKQKHLNYLYENFQMGDHCACKHLAEEHYCLNQMPCTQCDCDGLRKPKEI